MKPIKITERNIMFTQPMGGEYDLNLGLILGDENNFIIDTGLGAGSVASILEYIENSDNADKPIIVINTHHHWDHIWGNFVFEKKNSLIISHAKCLELFNAEWDESLTKNAEYQDGEIQKCLPNTTFEKDMYFSNDGIKIFHSPGHTIDCISVYDERDKVLYAGDNIGDTDDEVIPWIETDFETFQALIEMYGKYDFDVCISGHAKPQTKDIIDRMREALPEAWEDQQSQEEDLPEEWQK